MVEVTKNQGKEIIASLNKMHKIGDKRAASQERFHNKQLEYFKSMDEELAKNQQGLVITIVSL
jgi:hypothetical protein